MTCDSGVMLMKGPREAVGSPILLQSRRQGTGTMGHKLPTMAVTRVPTQRWEEMSPSEALTL